MKNITGLEQEDIQTNSELSLPATNISEATELLKNEEIIDIQDNPNLIYDYKFVLRSIMKTGVPFFLSRLINTGVIYGNLIILSQKGTNIFLAGSYIFTTQGLVVYPGIVISYILPKAIQDAVDRNQPREVGDIMKAGLIISLVYTVPNTIFLCFAKDIYNNLEQPIEIISIANNYFKFLPLALPATYYLAFLQEFSLKTGKQWLIPLADCINGIMIMTLSSALCFGPLNLGVEGVVTAYILSPIITTLLYLFAIYFDKTSTKYNIFSIRTNDLKSYLLLIGKKGSLISLQFSVELIGVLALNLFIGRYGSIQLQAYEISSQFLSLVLVPLYSFSQAATKIISDTSAEKKVIVAARTNFLLSISMGLFFAGTTAGLSYYLPENFVSDESVIRTTQTFICLNAITIFGESIRDPLAGILRGSWAKDTLTPSLVGGLVITLAALCLGYILGDIAGYQGNGFLFARAICTLIGAFLLIPRVTNVIKKYSDNRITSHLEDKQPKIEYKEKKRLRFFPGQEDLESKEYLETNSTKNSMTFDSF